MVVGPAVVFMRGLEATANVSWDDYSTSKSGYKSYSCWQKPTK